MDFLHLDSNPFARDNDVEVYHADDDYGERYEFKADIQTPGEGMPEVDPMDLRANAIQFMGSRKPIPDFKTKNESFIQVFKDLKKLGVTKNNKFHLMLYDRELQGIDPYSPTLPLELKIRIQLECIVNPWYWLREICRIPVDGKPIVVGGGSEFLLDRNSVATWYLFLNGIDHYASKPRQCGKTQDAIAKFNYAYHYGTASSTILFFNKDSGMSRTNLYRLKCQRDMMPPYLQMRIGFTDDGKATKETDNVTTMKNPINGNIIKTQPKANSADMAMKLGRGETSNLHYYDEFDFEPFNTTILDSSAFSYSTASQNAEANGALHCRIFTSTPGDADHRDGITANEYISKMVVWKESYFNMPIDEFKKVVNSGDYNGVVFVEHTWKQLKKPVQWYETQCRLVGFKQEVILRELDLQRISGSNNSPFSREVLIYLNGNKREPVKTIDINDNLTSILVYDTIHKDYPYIFSIDPAQGLALDRTAFTLINPYNLRVVAEYRSPFIPFAKFLKLIVWFLDEYAPRSMIVIENNRGRELISMLEETKYRWQIWMNEDGIGDLPAEKINKYGQQEYDAIIRRYKGFATTNRTRPMLFDILDTFVQERIDDLYSQYVVEEILTLIRMNSGKVIHAPGKHDDVLFSYLIGICVYYNASNLEQYGIKRGAKEPGLITGDETNEELTHKMLMLLDKLPAEYKSLFAKAAGKNESNESLKYAAQVQAASRNKKRDYGVKDPSNPMNIDEAYMDPTGDAWRMLDEQIWRSNELAKHSPGINYGHSDPMTNYDMFGGYDFGNNQGGGSGSSDLDDFFNNL